MKNKNNVLFLLLLGIILITYTGCSENQSDIVITNTQDHISQTTEGVLETTAIYPEYNVDYGGVDFNILYFDAVAHCGWNDLPCDIEESEINGDILSDAVYNRNRKIEDLYNININATGYTDTSSACPKLEKQIMAGTTEFDAVFPAWNSLYGLTTNDYLTDLNPLVDFSMPWYDADSLNAFSILGKTYAVISDITYMDKLLSIVIFFNQQMVNDFNLGDLYQTVIDHEWTFENMLTMCSTVYSDINGNGNYDVDDCYGFISQNDATYELYNGSGLYYCRIDDDGMPYQTQNNERSISIMQKIYNFMNDSTLFFNRQTNNLSTIDICNMFAENRGLFILRQIQASFELRNMQSDFGVIPTPLMDDQQENYHTSIGYTVAIAQGIPSIVKDVQMSSVVLDTLAAESYYNVNDTLYETILGEKLFRDTKSKENLEIILNNRLYDPGCVYNFGNIASDWFQNYKKGPNQIASIMEKNSNKIDKAINDFITALQSDKTR